MKGECYLSETNMYDIFPFYFYISCFSLEFLAISSALCPESFLVSTKIWEEITCTDHGNIRSHVVIHAPFMKSKACGLERVTVTN